MSVSVEWEIVERLLAFDDRNDCDHPSFNFPLPPSAFKKYITITIIFCKAYEYRWIFTHTESKRNTRYGNEAKNYGIDKTQK